MATDQEDPDRSRLVGFERSLERIGGTLAISLGSLVISETFTKLPREFLGVFVIALALLGFAAFLIFAGTSLLLDSSRPPSVPPQE